MASDSGTSQQVIGRGRTQQRARVVVVPAGKAVGQPRTPRVYVERDVLWRLLDGAAECAVTVVIGPAGAGKSLGVAGWLWAREEPDAVWLNADSTLVTKVLRQAMKPPAGSADRPRLVVIDDAHQLPAPTLRAINDLIAREPDGVRLILLTPWDLPIDRLGPGLLGQLTVIRGDVLRLTRAEASVLVAAHARSEAEDVLAAVLDETEGWCAATVLVSRAIGAAADVHAAARDHGHNASVATGVASPTFAALADDERHVLLSCGAEDTVSTSAAVRLTGDPLAGETLARIADVGLLVTRLDHPEVKAGAVAESVYRIHPMLREVIRCLHLSGGDDVSRARDAVAAAARSDLGRGDIEAAFRRFAFAGDLEAVADLLAEHPLELVATKLHTMVRSFERRHADAVQGQPRCWWPIALERWLAGDYEAAGHWTARVLAASADADDDRARADAACARLLRSRTGLETVAEAVADGQAALAGLDSAADREEARLLLSLELGVAQNWLGDLDQAEQNLAAAAMLARARAWHGLRAEALSHLALTEFMCGREQDSRDQAAKALSLLAKHPGYPAAEAVRDRARLARHLVGLGSLPLNVEEPVVPERTGAGVDLLVEFWSRHAAAVALIARHQLADAQRLVEPPWSVPALPDHLHLTSLVDRSLIALVRRDRNELESLAGQLADGGALSEASLALGLADELDGSLEAAETRFRAAAEASGRPLGAYVAVAHACRAQLAEARGDRETARAEIDAALAATEVRRSLVPFLGWSTHGTPIGQILTAVQASHPTAWGAEVLREITDRPGIWEYYAAIPPSGSEESADDSVHSQLSPRELEVLRELARGARYADVATALYVSLNTVKTHVSSLYAKLGVTCRTDALAIARRMHLI